MTGARPLAVLTDGGVGDLLMAEPALNALHRHFGVGLSVLTSPYAGSILEGNPAVAEVIADDESASRRAAAERLRPHAFTHAVVFWSNARIAAIVQQAGIPVRVGQARRLYSFRYTIRVPIRTEAGDTTSHWSDVQMDYARALGAQPRAEDYRVEIRLEDRDRKEASDLLAGHRIGGQFVALHAARGLSGPFAGLGAARAARMTRVRWPVWRFAQIGDALGDAFDAPVVLTGGRDSQAIVSDIGLAMRRRNVVLAGRTSLRGLAALYERATAVVALDSGPMHIAAAVGAPTVGIFALRSDLPQRWRPIGPNATVLGPAYPCPSWCRKETCKTFACYEALSPAAIVAKARAVAATAAAGRT